MRQRVRTLGGRFEIDSAAGSGTRLRISVPS
jgi:signal transduction histidine kinase